MEKTISVHNSSINTTTVAAVTIDPKCDKWPVCIIIFATAAKVYPSKQRKIDYTIK